MTGFTTFSTSVCKYASMQVCKYAIMQVCNHACMPVCRCMIVHVCKYSDQTLACPKGETKGELECGPAQSNLFGQYLDNIRKIFRQYLENI